MIKEINATILRETINHVVCEGELRNKITVELNLPKSLFTGIDLYYGKPIRIKLDKLSSDGITIEERLLSSKFKDVGKDEMEDLVRGLK